MNDPAPLSAVEIERFAMRLRADRERVVADLGAHRDAASTVVLDQTRVGRLSRQDALQAQQLALEAERRSKARLQRIDGALRRIDQDEFGDCFGCGEPILRARLESDPTVTRCLACAGEE